MGIVDKLAIIKEQKAFANLQAGKDFLIQNKLRPGIIETPSGLQYEILWEGDGNKPAINDSVICNYHGTLLNGIVFDSTSIKNKPATFYLNKVINGWKEALQMMPVGSKWKIYLPPHLAYGNQQVGTHISPNSALIFEVELLAIN